jgi:predicted outer membrane repeat protein
VAVGLISALIAFSAKPAPADPLHVVDPAGAAMGQCRINAPCNTIRRAVAVAHPGNLILINDLGPFLESDILIDKDLWLIGVANLSQDRRTVIDATGSGRHFLIRPGVEVQMYHLELINGLARSGGSITNHGSLQAYNVVWRQNTAGQAGGAITNLSDATFQTGCVFGSILPGRNVVRCTRFFNNHAARDGGALSNEGDAEIVADYFSSTFEQNDATNGGAVANEGTLTLTGPMEFSFNTAEDSGGAIHNRGTVEGRLVTLMGNQALQNGGAIANLAGSLALEFATFEANSAGDSGAAIYSTADATITSSTFEQNNAAQLGGAIANLEGGDLTVQGTDVERPDSRLTDNNSLRGGAIYSQKAADVRIIATVLESNVALTGGAIYSEDGPMTVDGSSISDNFASDGGGVYNIGGDVTIQTSDLELNRAEHGAAIENRGTLTLLRSLLSENSGTGHGGGLFNISGDATISQSAFVGNHGRNGGAIYNTGGTVSVVNSTLSGNDASTNGGAIYNLQHSQAKVGHSTLHGNRADGQLSNPPPAEIGGGIYTEGDVELFASIVTASTGDDCALSSVGSFTGDSNLVDDHAAGRCSLVSFDSVTALDAALSATQTHDLQAGSNAIDVDSLCVDEVGGAPVTEDQRGEPRDDGLCDAGAYEFQ